MEPNEGGGDAACWLHRVCEECGAIVDDANPHRAFCSRAVPAPPVSDAAPAREARWIPASSLASGLLFQLAAWVIVLADALHPGAALALAWVHAVALGWLTTVALSVLIRILPATTDRTWRFERVARGSLAGIVIGAALMVAGFVASAGALSAGAFVAAVSIGAYLFAAFATLAPPSAAAREAVISRSFAATFVMLAITVALGVALAVMVVRGAPIGRGLVLMHATFGIAGWLTLLTTGVATRTLGVILDVDSRLPRAHFVVGTALLLGLVLLAISGGAGAPATIAFVLFACAAAIFAADAADRARRSTVPNPASRIGVFAAAIWIVVAAALALAANLGFTAPSAAVAAALLGWIGSMVLAHLHHIGVRLIATSVLGEDDETPPWLLTSAPAAIATMLVYEAAVVALVASVVTDAAAVPLLAGVLGLVASALAFTNAARAIVRARATVRARTERFA